MLICWLYVRVMDHNPRHAILDSIIYGPVQSRRYGWSLGVNLLPIHKKLCNFDCVYCQLGWNDQNVKIKPTEFPTADAVINELQNWFVNNLASTPLDSVTLSGNGEPTLNPHFHEIALSLSQTLKSFSPSTKLILLTNGSQIHRVRIQKTLKYFAEVCVKHDPDFKMVNRPHTPYASVQTNFFHLKSLSNLVLQSCVFVGEVENLSCAYDKEWWEPILALQPQRLDLYTIDPTTSPTKIQSVSKLEMQRLKKFLSNKNICVRIVD